MSEIKQKCKGVKKIFSTPVYVKYALLILSTTFVNFKVHQKINK